MYFQRKRKDEERVPLSQAELEQKSDEEILRQMPWVAPRRSMSAYGRMLDWKERQAAEFAANPMGKDTEWAKRNRERLKDADPEPWKTWAKKHG